MWREVRPLPRGAARRGAAARTLTPFAIAILLLVVGWRAAALLVAVVALLLLAVRVLRPQLAGRLDRALGAFGELVGRVLALVLLTGFAAAVLVPVGLVRSALRRDLRLRGQPPRAGWQAHPSEATRVPPHRSFASEPLPPRTVLRQILHHIPTAVGAFVLLLALDYGLGWTYDDLVGTHDVPVADVAGGWPDRLVGSPATVDEPWMEELVDELTSLDVEYVPYLLVRTADHDGEHIHVEDGIRRTWEPADLPDDAPELWVFGGSTVWGEGHRDEHTLPSNLARLAHADGVRVRVVNMGERGSTTWQDVLRFEQALAARTAPVAAVFYGGVNDIYAQLQDPRSGPTHLNVDPTAASTPPVAPGLWERYRERSAIAAAAAWLRDLVAESPAQAGEANDRGPTIAERDGAAAQRAAVDDAVFVHEQAHVLVDVLAEQHGVPTSFVWQAHRSPGDAPYATFRQESPAAVDLSHALRHADEPVWVDDVHPDEDGARLVATTLWAELARQLDAVVPR